jgi:regulator of protease activity HflC (stomatin/prohibitin superfamily)
MQEQDQNDAQEEPPAAAPGWREQMAAAGQSAGGAAWRRRGRLFALGLIAATVYGAYRHPPVETVESGEIAMRSNRVTGQQAAFAAGPVLMVPGLHELHRYSLRDRVLRPADSARADGAAPFQSREGLSLGVDLSLRYALDPKRVAGIARQLPADIDHDVVEPALHGVIYRIFTSYTVKEIFSSKRTEIQQKIVAELRPRLAADGILLRDVQLGNVDLPREYRNGMDQMLAEELATEKMQYTLALKDQQVKETALEAEAEKVRREKAAEAAGNEQVIAARAQQEAMKHVLPFKEKQIEQRKLEAEAEKLSRIRYAEGNAEARRVEAAGEADSRRKLADAETYRLEQVGKVTSAQMERDGELLSKHPLLIQKTMADKLSDKVQVIIASPPAGGGFIGSALLGQAPPQAVAAVTEEEQ